MGPCTCVRVCGGKLRLEGSAVKRPGGDGRPSVSCDGRAGREDYPFNSEWARIALLMPRSFSRVYAPTVAAVFGGPAGRPLSDSRSANQ